MEIGQVPLLHGQALPAQLPQLPEEGQQLLVLPAPGIGPPVQGVLKALHPGLVPVVHRGGAGEAVQQHLAHPQPGLALLPLGRREAVRRPAVLGIRHILRSQQGQDPGRVVGAQNVQGAVKGGPGIVLPDDLHGVPEDGGVAAPQPVQGRRPEGIVHQPVGLAAQQIPPALAVGDLVAAVLPHLAQQEAVGLLLVHGTANFGNEVVRQLVGHVQPPAGGPLPQPVPHHGVSVPDDEPAIAVRRLLHRRQGPDAPPGVVILRPGVEGVPIIILGLPALGRPQLRIESLGVEIPAVAAGVVEHPVQHHPDAPAPGLPAQGAEVLLGAQHGVNAPVVRRVVPVVAVGLKNRTQVQRTYSHTL